MANTKAVQPKVKKKRGKWFRELGSELKKVTWPTFGKVVRQTGVVLGVTIAFLLVVMAIDQGLLALYRLLIKVY